MGWGLQKSDRDAVLKCCLLSTTSSKANPKLKATPVSAGAPKIRAKCPTIQAQVAVADMNAKLRQKAVDISSGAISMQRVVRNVVREVAKDASEHIILVFDAPCVMPEIRNVLWKSRYAGGAAAPPKAIEVQASIAFCSEVMQSSEASRTAPPVPYSVMFTPGAAKKATWEAMAHIARREAAVAAAEMGIRATVIDSENVIFDTSGPGTPIPGWCPSTKRYGEADLKIYALGQAAAVEQSKSVVLHSVDTDLILQAVATVHPPTGPQQLSAWVPKHNFVIKLKTCTVDARELIRHFGHKNVAKRLNSAFWFVMAGGTDYSRPASDQGYSKRALADAAHPLVITAAAFTETGPADVRKTLARLKGTRKVARTVCGKAKKSGRSLKRTLQQAAAVVQYYGLINTDPPASLFE